MQLPAPLPMPLALRRARQVLRAPWWTKLFLSRAHHGDGLFRADSSADPGPKKKEETVKSARTGDKIVTSSGIHGLITNVKDTTVIVKVADNVKLEIEKSHIDKITRPDSAPTPKRPPPPKFPSPSTDNFSCIFSILHRPSASSAFSSGISRPKRLVAVASPASAPSSPVCSPAASRSTRSTRPSNSASICRGGTEFLLQVQGNPNAQALDQAIPVSASVSTSSARAKSASSLRATTA